MPKNSSGVIPLSALAIDECARLHTAQVPAEARHALRALGLTDGATLRVCKQGEPCVVQVRSTRIGITRRIAQAILVEPHVRVPARG